MSSRFAAKSRTSIQSPLLKVLLESRSAWWAVFVFSMAINLLMLAPTLYMMQVSDRVVTSRNMMTLVVLTVIAIGAMVIMGALEWTRSRIMVRIGVRLDRELAPRLVTLSHRYSIEAATEGNRLMSDLSLLRNFITGYGMLAALDAPWVPIYFLVTLMLHPWLAVIVFLGSLAIVILTLITEKITRGPLERANASAAEAVRFASNNLRHSEVIEAMGMLPAMLHRWQSKQNRHLFEQARASDRAGLTTAASKFVRYTNQSLAMGVGGLLFVQADASPGVIFAASLLSSRIMQPIEQLIAAWSQWGSASQAWSRIDEALKRTERPDTGISLPAPKGEVVLEGVFGGPPGASSAFVQNITLKIPAGASVAVVGASASGKSSLMRLIAGVWPPFVGTVRIDGADVLTWPRDKLGPYIGYLPQDVELIEGTVAENIARLGEIDSERVIAAAQAAGVHEMVLQLPNGYGTQVGPNGAFLSGGQRQRIALARAMYGDPPLLLLDEPNANLDDAGEMALDVALKNAKARGQTVLIVSHRPIAIRNAELLLVMQAGQVSVYGPRELVLSKLANAAEAERGGTTRQGPASNNAGGAGHPADQRGRGPSPAMPGKHPRS